jgi:hypothetical protein
MRFFRFIANWSDPLLVAAQTASGLWAVVWNPLSDCRDVAGSSDRGLSANLRTQPEPTSDDQPSSNREYEATARAAHMRITADAAPDLAIGKLRPLWIDLGPCDQRHVRAAIGAAVGPRRMRSWLRWGIHGVRAQT